VTAAASAGRTSNQDEGSVEFPLVLGLDTFGDRTHEGDDRPESHAQTIRNLKARDVTLIAVSGALIEKLLAYREQMGWSFNWASSYESDFNADLGFSSSPEQTREAIEPILDQLPPVAFRNARPPARTSTVT
jgi:Bacterial protein of unknown function (DUF899)